MDQKRLFLAIAISVAILLVFQVLAPHPVRPVQEQHPATADQGATSQSATNQSATSQAGTGQPATGQPAPGVSPNGPPNAPPHALAARTPPREVPRVKIVADSITGSISLLGARLDDVVLNDYRVKIDKPALVHVLDPPGTPKPNYVQFGWSAAPDSKVKLPDSDTLWTASAPELSTGKPVTLSWDNGQGQTFDIALSIDDDYMFTVQQSVHNTGAAAVALFPWSRISRDYTPTTQSTYLVHEGLIADLDGTLYDSNVVGIGNGNFTYAGVKSLAAKNDGVALDKTATAGWAGITDKYWLTALIPNQSAPVTSVFRYTDQGGPSYQVYIVTKNAERIAPGGRAQLATRVFAGAKEVHLLDRYETQDKISRLSFAVDWGLFFFITKPFFYAIDWLNTILGNFGLAIMVFTVCVKGLFFPLANKSYRSMSKMKLLGPKIKALREQFKDDPAKLQAATMAMYRTEKVNPVSGCLPMVIQVPVFFSLYKVIYTTIEMRQAPFFGWIHDLSAVDPTNVFNLFGLIPFDPMTISPMLHLGAWPLIMGLTMFFQQKLNPPPPDPVQAKLFQFMPLIFMFMLARFPVGLIIYYSWNNLLTIGQQWLIMRQNPAFQAQPGPDLTAEQQAAAIEAGRLLFAAECRFFFAAQRLDQLPPPAGPEVAFAGRSNVGKSSLINALTGRGALARTSAQPGRTRQLNFFDLGERLVLVDMPGYGYAQAAREVKEDWQGLMFAFLRGRPTLRRVMLLLDARIDVKPSDLAAMDLLDRAAVTYQLVLTKADSVKPAALAGKQAAVADLARKRPAAHMDLLTTSSDTGLGIAGLRAALAALAAA